MRFCLVTTVLPFLLTACGSPNETKDTINTLLPMTSIDSYPSADQKNDGICQPGTSLGLCTVCDLEGRYQIPLSDTRCPDFSCAAMDAYHLVMDDDQQVCMHRSFGIAKSACSPMGGCAERPNVHICPVVEDVVAMRAVLPCAMMMGCNGQEPPRIEQAADGRPCPNGTCMGGQCILDDSQEAEGIDPTPRCSMFAADPFCEEGVEDGIPYCEFRVATPEFRSCSDVCEDVGSFCLSAWDDDRNTCRRQEPQPCSTRELDQICRCAVPPEPLRMP